MWYYNIRDCQYGELGKVAALVVDSFYDKKKINLVARKLYRLAETNRLQQNFPYPESRSVHRMLVVEATTTTTAGAAAPAAASSTATEIVGFCDVDTRPCATKLKLPRPYLSDLAIDPGHRRKGLARKLVEESEAFVLGRGDTNFDELWIRVAETNEAALGLYRDRLGYSQAEWSTESGESRKQTDVAEPNNDKNANEPEAVLTLRRDLRE